MKIILIYDLAMIVFSVVFIVEHSGFIQSLSKMVWQKTKKTKWQGELIRKPFSCSLCLSFWLVLAYLLINDQTIIFAVFVAVIASISSVVVNKVMGMFFRLIHKLY
jgi:hypothetical protein